MTCCLDERVGCSYEKEIGTENLLSLGKLLLCLLEIEIDVESLDEICDWIAVFIVLLSNKLDNLLQLLLVLSSVACSASVGDDSCGKISKDPRAGGLNGIDEWGGKEELADGVTGWFVVEEWEKSPVDEPCAVSKLCQRVIEKFCVDRFLDLGHLLHCCLPVGGENLGCQLSPCCC